MSKGSSGGFKGTSGGGGGKIINQLAPNVEMVKLSDLPSITGENKQEIETATKIRKTIGKQMFDYAITSNQATYIATQGSNKEKNDFVNSLAKRLSFGNDELIPQKRAQAIETLNNANRRYARFADWIAKAPSTAAYWKDINNDYSKGVIKDYIDGKKGKPRMVGGILENR